MARLNRQTTLRSLQDTEKEKTSSFRNLNVPKGGNYKGRKDSFNRTEAETVPKSQDDDDGDTGRAADPIYIPWHTHPLVSVGTTRDSGWSCSGMLRLEGCMKGCDPNKNKGFGQSIGWERNRCEHCDYDLCDECLKNARNEMKMKDELDKLVNKEKGTSQNLLQIQSKYDTLVAKTAAEIDVKSESEKQKEERIRILTEEAETLRSRVDEVNSLRDAERKKSEDTLKKETQRFETQLDDLRSNRKKLENQLTSTSEKYKTSQKDTQTQKQAINHLEDAVQKATGEKWQIELELAKVQKEAEVLRVLTEKNENSGAALKLQFDSSLRMVSSDLKVKFQDLDTRMADFKEREQQLLTRCDDTEKESATLKEQFAEKEKGFQEALSAKDKKFTEIKVRLQFEKSLHDTNKIRLKTETQNHKDEITELKSDLAESETEKTDAKRDLQKVTAKIEVLQAQLIQSEENVKSLKEQLADSQRVNREFEEKLLSSKDDMKAICDNIEKVENSMTAAFSDRLAALESQIFENRMCKLMDLKSFGKELDAFLSDKERLEDLQTEASNLSTRLEETETKLSRTKWELERSDEKRVSVEQRLTQKISETNALQENMKSLQEKLAKAVPAFPEFEGYQLDRDSDEKEVKFGSKDGKSFALKWSKSPEMFNNEAEMLKSLQGEVAPLLLANFDSANVIVMQRGLMSLKQYLQKINRKHSVSNIQEFNSLLSQFIRCLKVLERKEIVHCYLRPEHIYMFGDDGKWRIIDYSQAAYLNSSIKLPKLRSLLYSSPEIIASQEGILTDLRADPSQDLWSLGIVLFECISGKTFFKDEENAKNELLKIYESKEIDLDCVPEHEASAVIKGLLHPNPQQRSTVKDLENYLAGKAVNEGANSEMLAELKKIQEAVKEVETLKQMSQDIKNCVNESKEEVLASISEVAEKITKLSDQTSKLGLMMLRKIGDNFPRMFVMFPTTKAEMSVFTRLKSPIMKAYKLFLVCEGDGAEGSTCHLTSHAGYDVDITQGWVRKSLPAIKMGLDLFSKSTYITGVGLPFFGSLMDYLPSDVCESMEEATEYIESVCENIESIGEYLEDFEESIEEQEEAGIFEVSDEKKTSASTETPKAAKTARTSVAQLLEEKAQKDPDELKKCLTQSADAIRSMLKNEDDSTGGLQQVMVRQTNEVIWVCEQCTQSEHVVGFELREPEEPEEEGPEEEKQRQGEQSPAAQVSEVSNQSVSSISSFLSSKLKYFSTKTLWIIFAVLVLIVIVYLAYYLYSQMSPNPGFISVVRTTYRPPS